MLNGLAPVLIFQFYRRKQRGGIAELDIITEFGKETIIKDSRYYEKTGGEPIPIYLSEKLFKVAWIGHDASINIGTKSIADQIFQQPYNSNITIELAFNRKDSIIAKLLPLLDLCYNKISSADYNISYFNQDILIFKSKLTDVKQNSRANSELTELSITLSKDETESAVKDFKAGTPIEFSTTGA